MQLGGGIRDLDTIERYLDDGLQLHHHRHRRGEEPRLPAATRARAFGGHIIVGLDAKDGKVATDGWSKLTGHEVVDLAQQVRGLRRRGASSTPTSAATAC